MDLSNSSALFSCQFCDHKVATASGLRKHCNKLHPNLFEAKRQPTLLCGLCDEKFIKQKDLCKHVSEFHLIPIEIRELKFNNVDEFIQWKKKQEDESKFAFSKERSCPSAKGKLSTDYYYCHRSGSFSSESKGIRQPRANITNKCGYQCTAFIISKIGDDGRVRIDYCLDHYGHDSSLARVPLPDATRERVKDYLLDGLPVNWIQNKIKGPPGLGNAKTRDQLINKCDVYNIQRSSGLRTAEKDADDMTSVTMWVEENEGDVFFHYEAPEEKDFILGMQTDYQRQMMLDFGKEVICIDSSHGLTNYHGYQLTTILVVTDQGKGFPVAWFIISQETQDVLMKCFKALRERIGSFTTKFFMSDDAHQYWNAWMETFGDCGQEPRKLLCIWHVKRNWAKQVKSKVPADLRDSVLKRLNELASAEMEQKFTILLEKFISDLRGAGCDEFLNYFKKKYSKSQDRQCEWALFARRESVVNTNTILEAFHRDLKHNYLEGKQNRRMDVLIQILLQVAVTKMQDYNIAKEFGLSSNTHRLREMHKRHQSSLGLSASGVKIDAVGWLVPSQTNKGFYYHVSVRQTACTCMVKCRACRVCPELYSCNCPDSWMRMTACKHMHLIHEKFSRSEETTLGRSTVSQSVMTVRSGESAMEIESETDDVEDDGRLLQESNCTDQLMEEVSGMMKSNLDQLLQCTPRLDEIRLRAIKTKLKEIRTLMNMSTPSFMPALSEDAGPANKKVKRQRRF